MTWLDLLFPPRCTACGRPPSALCRRCAGALRAPATAVAITGVDGAAALLDYEGAGRDLVHGLKFHQRRALLPVLGEALAGLPVADGAVVTWVPSTGAGRRRDGTDPAARLARVVAAARRRPCRRLLARRGSVGQRGRDRAARLAGPSLRATGPIGGSVLVIDDVVTTGATLREAAEALRAGGAASVWALALARTPLKVGAGLAD